MNKKEKYNNICVSYSDKTAFVGGDSPFEHIKKDLARKLGEELLRLDLIKVEVRPGIIPELAEVVLSLPMVREIYMKKLEDKVEFYEGTSLKEIYDTFIAAKDITRKTELINEAMSEINDFAETIDSLREEFNK